MRRDDAWELASREALGTVLLDPRLAADCCGCTVAEDYRTPTYQAIHRAISALLGRGVEVDLLGLAVELEAGGHAYAVETLHDLVDVVSGTSAAPSRWRAVRQYGARGRARAYLAAASEDLDGLPVDELAGRVDHHVRALTRLTEGQAVERRQGLQSVLRDVVQYARERHASKEPLLGPPTVLADLDRLLLGSAPGCLYMLTGKTGRGKTAVALQWALNAAKAQTHHVLVVSLEMGSRSLGTRLLASAAAVNGQSIRSGQLTDGEVDRLLQGVGKLGPLAPYLSIIDTPGLSVDSLRAECRAYTRAANGPPLGLVVVDYLQLLTMATKENREQTVAAASKALVELARDLNVCVLALSQLNEQGAVRESRAPEHDASAIIDLKVPDDATGDDVSVELVVRKHRHGPVGVVPAVFHRSRQTFDGMQKETW